MYGFVFSLLFYTSVNYIIIYGLLKRVSLDEIRSSKAISVTSTYREQLCNLLIIVFSPKHRNCILEKSNVLVRKIMKVGYYNKKNENVK